MPTTKSKRKRGGVRPGAGRPHKHGVHTVSTNIRLPIPVREFLESDASGDGNVTDSILAIITRSTAYKRFLADRDD